MERTIFPLEVVVEWALSPQTPLHTSTMPLHSFGFVSEKSKVAMRGVRPIGPTSVGVWRKHLGRIVQQQAIHGTMTPDLVGCGYESSPDWEVVLDGVLPDKSNSWYPEKKRFWQRISQSIDASRKIAIYRRKKGLSRISRATNDR